MATTVERPQAAHVVAHATEYPADRNGDGSGYDQHNKSKRDADSHEGVPGQFNDSPAVLVDAHHLVDHALDGVAAYKATALKVLEPGIDHGPVLPLRGPVNGLAAETVRHAYLDHDTGKEVHEVNLAT